MIERLLRDGAVYAASAIVSRGLAFLLLPLYTRLLPSAEYGALELIVTVGLLVNLVAPLEIGQGMAREWSEQADARARGALASTALGFTVATHALFLAPALVAAPWIGGALLGDAHFAPAWRAGACFIVANAVVLQMLSQFRWDLRPGRYFAGSAAYALFTALLGGGGAWMAGLEGLLWGQTLAALLAIGAAAALQRDAFGLGMDAALLRTMLAFSLPLAGASALAFASFHANRLILGALASLDAVALYGVAAKVAGLSTLLIVGVQGALTPLIYAHHRDPRMPHQLARAFEAFLGLALLVCLGLGLFAVELIEWVATPAFAAAAPLLAWLAPAALLSQMYIFLPGIAIARRTGVQLGVSAVSALLALALNRLLIESHGALGAAWAQVAAALSFLMLWGAASQRAYPLALRPLVIVSSVAAYGLVLFVLRDGAGAALRAAALAGFAVFAWASGLLRLSELRQALQSARQ